MHQTATLVQEKLLPDAPLQVWMEDFQPDGALLSKQQIKSVKKYFKDHPEASQVSYKKLSQLPHYGYVVKIPKSHSSPEQYLMIYRGKKNKPPKKTILGEGTFGTVKLGQNIDTKEWTAIKISPRWNEKTQTDYGFVNQKSHQDEQSIWQKLTDTSQLITKNKGKVSNENPNIPKEKYLLTLPLFKGKNLACYRNRFSLNTALRLPANLLYNYHNTIQKNCLIHRDIKPENIICNPVTKELMLIDMGGAKSIQPPQTAVITNLDSTTPIYLAPEIFSHFKNSLTAEAKSKLKNKIKISYDVLYNKYLNQTKTFTFDEKTEIFAVGRTLAYTLGLAYDDKKLTTLDLLEGKIAIKYYSENHPKLNQSCIKNPYLRKKIMHYLKKMTAVNPQSRPTIKEALNFFEEIAEYHLTAVDKCQKIGFIDIAEWKNYLNAPNAPEWKNLCATLQLADQVWIVDTTPAQHTTKDYLLFRQILSQHDVVVGDKLFTSSNHGPQHYLSAISQRLSEKNPADLTMYFYASQYAVPPVINETTIKIATVKIETHPKIKAAENLKQQFQSIYLSHYQLTAIETALHSDLDRMTEKYSLNSKTTCDRKNAIDEAISNLRDKFNDNNLSAQELITTLDNLQKTMIGRNFWTRWLGLSCTSKKVVTDLKEQITQMHGMCLSSK